MKLVGKINIEVWDGDPNDPNSKLKQEVEEYNDVHPDMDSAWDTAFYHRAWIDENWQNEYMYTNPITGNRGYFKPEPEYYSIRLGFHDDKEKLSENIASCASNTNLKYFDSSSYKQVGIDEKGYLYCSDGATNTGINSYIGPTQERLKISEKSRKALDSIKSLYYLHVAVPIEEGSQYEYINRVSFSYQYSPTGEDFTIKNIGLYACYTDNDSTSVEGDSPSRYITSNIKDSSIGITFHKFLEEIPVKSTDYIKFSYVIDFITVVDIDPPSELLIKNKEGKDVRAIRFPVLLGFRDRSSDETLKDYLKCWYDDSTPIQWRHIQEISRSRYFSKYCGVTPNHTGFFQQLTITWGNNLRSRLKIEGNEEFLEDVKYMGSFNDNWEAISSKLFLNSGTDGVSSLYPIIGYDTYYGGINEGDVSSNTQNLIYNNATTLKNKIVKGYDNNVTSTIHLKAVDDRYINHSFKGLVEIPFITSYGSTADKGYIAYLTVFEEPLEKTKFDELKVSKDATFFNNKWGNPFNKDLSKSEEQE